MENLVIVMADEARKDIATHEYYSFVRMPNVDRLRQEGITVHNCFSQYPICCPSRASFNNGKYPHQFGMWNNRSRFPEEEQTLGHHLASLGYDAVAFGKTHAMNPGFRSHRYDIRATMGYDNHGSAVDSEHAVGTFEGDVETYCDFVAVNQFDEYVRNERAAGKPFVAFVGIYAPHPPWYPPPEYAEMYDPTSIELPEVVEGEPATKPRIQAIPRERWTCHPVEVQKKIIACYLGMMTLFDHCVGRVLGTLEETGLLEETVVVVTSDHGDQLGEHDMIGKFHNLYEGSLRVPLFLRLPGRQHAGVETDQLIEMIDVYPTLCELLHIPEPAEPHEPAGVSFARAFADPDYQHRKYVHSMIEDAQMVRTDEWKLVFHANDRCELYNLQTDPREVRNLYGSQDEVCKTIKVKLKDEMLRHLISCKRNKFNKGRNVYFG